MEELTQNNRIEGTVTAILFRNEENGYTVLRLGPAPYLWGAV